MQENSVLVHTEHACAPSDQFSRSKGLLALAVGIVVISVLGIVAFLTYQAKRPACQEVSDREKVKMTYRLKDHNSHGEYDIFTAQRTATYLVYGEVKCLERTEDIIFVKQSWKKLQPSTMQRKRCRYWDAFVAMEETIVQDSRVYLLFNQGRPSCNETVFHVYEL